MHTGNSQDKTRNALRTAHWDYVNSIISDGLEKAFLELH